MGVIINETERERREFWRQTLISLISVNLGKNDLIECMHHADFLLNEFDLRFGIKGNYKSVACVSTSNGTHNNLTAGKIYDVIDKDARNGWFKIKDDNGKIKKYTLYNSKTFRIHD